MKKEQEAAKAEILRELEEQREQIRVHERSLWENVEFLTDELVSYTVYYCYQYCRYPSSAGISPESLRLHAHWSNLACITCICSEAIKCHGK